MADSPNTRELIDPYLDWSAVETRPWTRFGLDCAIVHLKARGDAAAKDGK